MNDSLWTFLFEIANFLALAAILAWLLFNPVRNALADQQAKMRQVEEDATRKLADAESLRREVESQRQSLAGELHAMRDKAHEAAKQEAEQILREARKHADHQRAALKRDALHIEQAQMARISRAVSTATYDAMKRFLQQVEGPELEQALIKTACRELKAMSDNSLAPVTIESATPLDEDALHLIQASLGDAADSADFRVVPDLEGGLRISTSHGLIDASVAGLANFAEQSLSAEMDSIIREESESE